MYLPTGCVLLVGRVESLTHMRRKQLQTPDVTPRHCPECQGHAWPHDTRGRRHCPQCHAVVAITRRGIRTITRHTWYRHGGVRVSSSVRLYRVVNPSDGAILCACCALPTDILHSIDGRIDRQDELQQVKVQRGFTASPGNVLRPDYEVRHIPRTIRGRICNACALAFHATEIASKEKRVKPTVRIGPFPHWNNRRQNIEADNGIANWANTGHAEWMQLSSAHYRLGCGCPRCMAATVGELETARMVASITGAITLSVLRAPLVHYVPTPPVAVYRPIVEPKARVRQTWQGAVSVGGPVPVNDTRCKHGLPHNTCAWCRK